jgi:hypothetical protein
MKNTPQVQFEYFSFFILVRGPCPGLSSVDMSAGFASDWEQSDRAQMQLGHSSKLAGQELQISPIGTCRSDRKPPIHLTDPLTVNLLASSPKPYISPARTNGSNFDSVVTSPGISSSLSPEPEPGRLPTKLAQRCESNYRAAR